MSYVVTEPCIKCKYTDCVEVCPVNCFYEGANFIVIHPDECIDCGACEPVCPSKAIFPDGEVPEQYREYIALNQEFSQKWPNLSSKRDPLPTAEDYKAKTGKRGELDPTAGG